jgi:tetratricopeptide (TPR) repeat protein
VNTILLLISRVIFFILRIIYKITNIAIGKVKKQVEFYEFFGKANNLTPVHVMATRGLPNSGFNNYFYEREIDNIIKDSIKNNKNVLITGNPLAGKTRAVYQSLISFKDELYVIIPRRKEIIIEDIWIPNSFGKGRKGVIVFDDMEKFAALENFKIFIQRLIEKNIIIIGTCRIGDEFEILGKILETELSLTFKNNIKEVERISKEKAIEISRKAGVEIPTHFDGNIGSVFINLDAIKKRYKLCSNKEKCILKAIRSLYRAGIYEEREKISIDRIKALCKKRDEMEMKQFEWNALFDKLKHSGFIPLVEKDSISIEQVYYESEKINGKKIEIVFDDSFDEINNLKDLLIYFTDDAEALFNIGYRAYDIGLIDLRKAEFMKIAIEAYKGTFKFRTYKKHPKDYAMTQNNLGLAYGELSVVENKKENCIKAIRSYEEVLRFCTYKNFPMQFAMAKSNLGIAYCGLAEIENKKDNCNKAVLAYEDAFNLYTFKDFPLQFANTNNNLGIAYLELSRIEDKKKYCNIAIKAFNEALRVNNYINFPWEYAMTQNNLGNAFEELSEIENKKENCHKAIRAYTNTLIVFSLKDYPMQYSLIQNNIGLAHGELSKIENKKENCIKAILAYKEALKVYSFNNFPMQYAVIQNNIGNIYGDFSEIEDKLENSEKAILAYKEALRFRTFEGFPVQYATTQNNLGTIYGELAGIKNWKENCNKAIQAYKEALRVRTIEDFPLDFAKTHINLGNVFSVFSEIENKKENCNKAIQAYETALRIYYYEHFPIDYAMIQYNLGLVYWSLAEVENKKEYCEKAIRAFKESLKVYTPEEFPDRNQMLKNNLEALIDFCKHNK